MLPGKAGHMLRNLPGSVSTFCALPCTRKHTHTHTRTRTRVQCPFLKCVVLDKQGKTKSENQTSARGSRNSTTVRDLGTRRLRRPRCAADSCVRPPSLRPPGGGSCDPTETMRIHQEPLSISRLQSDAKSRRGRRTQAGAGNLDCDSSVTERIKIHTSHISVPLVHQTQPNT